MGEISNLTREGLCIIPVRSKDKRPIPISGFSKWKKKLDGLSGVHNWRLHDLRRTAGSAVGDLGVAPHVIDLIQNHRTPTMKGITGIYNKSTYWREQKEALELWARHLESLLEKVQKTSGTAYQAHENDTGLAC